MKSIITQILLLISFLVTAQNWQAVNITTTDDLNDIFFISESEGYIASEVGSIFKTTDGGENWNSIFSNPEIQFNYIYSKFVNSGDVKLFAYGFNNGQPVLVSTFPNQQFVNWSIESIDYYPFQSQIDNYIVYYQDAHYLNSLSNEILSLLSDNVGYYGVNDGKLLHVNPSFNEIYKSIDNGETWVQLNNYPLGFGSNQSSYARMKSFGDTLIIHYTYPNYTVYSFDNGNSWNEIPDIEVGANYCEIINENTIFGAGLPASQLNVQQNFQPWENNFTMPENIRRIYFYNDNLGFVLGENGMVYKTTNMGGLLSTTEVEEVKKKLILHPNPATEKLYISLPMHEEIQKLEIVNMEGKLIHCLATTSHEVHIDFLVKGSYILRIHTAENVYSKKFLKN